MNNILIVDDEKEITDLLEVYLVGEGYKVFKFYSAQGVMDCLQKEKTAKAPPRFFREQPYLAV